MRYSDGEETEGALRILGSKWFELPAAVAISIVAAGTVYDIVGRRAGLPFVGLAELTQLMMVIIVLGGILCAAILRGHINVTFLTSRLPSPFRAVVGLFVLLLVVAISGLTVWAGTQGALESFRFKAVYPVWDVPRGIPMLAVPLAFLLYASIEILNLVRSLGRRAPRAGAAEDGLGERE